MNIISSNSFNLNSLITTLIILGLLLLSACGGGSSEVEKIQLISNNAPSVNAGQDLSTLTDQSVAINASASDSDGTIESYIWVQTSGTAVNLINSNFANASFIAPSTNGESQIRLTFQITATDDKGASATDSVTITVSQPVSNAPPEVNAGDDININEQTFVQLNAEASDRDGTVDFYAWIQMDGTDVNLVNSNFANASFTAPMVGSGSEVLSFSVTVTDNNGASATDSISVLVNANTDNNVPVINITSPINNGSQNLGEFTIFTATANDIEDGDISNNIEWLSNIDESLGSGSEITAQLSLGDHIITATIKDSGDQTSANNVNFSINDDNTYGVATLSWTPPTENTDDSTLTDLASFKIYYGESENELVHTITIDSSKTTSTIRNLNTGRTYYFAVTAINEQGVESEKSDISSKFIES